MYNDLISIVVPVYNAQKYLEIALEAIICQNYTNWELLLIDDGSSDESGFICDKYTLKDHRIKTFHTNNKGAGAARNVGIKNAIGKYICFVDADDLISYDYVSYLYENLINNQLDMMICGYAKVYDFDKISWRRKCEKLDTFVSEEALEELLYRKSFTAGPCCKLVKANIVKYNLFPEGKLYEDQGCIYKWIAESRKIGYSATTCYLYLMHDNSCQHSEFDIRKMDHVYFAQEIAEYVFNNYPMIYSAAINRLFTSAIIIFRMIPVGQFLQENDELKKIICETRKTVFLDKKAKKATRLLAGISFINVDIFKLLGKIYDKIILQKLRVRMRY